MFKEHRVKIKMVGRSCACGPVRCARGPGQQVWCRWTSKHKYPVWNHPKKIQIIPVIPSFCFRWNWEYFWWWYPKKNEMKRGNTVVGKIVVDQAMIGEYIEKYGIKKKKKGYVSAFITQNRSIWQVGEFHDRSGYEWLDEVVHRMKREVSRSFRTQCSCFSVDVESLEVNSR